MQQVAQIVDVLHDERTVVAGLMDASLQLLWAETSALRRGDRIAGGAHDEEHDGDQDEHRGDDKQETGDDEAEEPSRQPVFLGFRRARGRALRRGLRRCVLGAGLGHAKTPWGRMAEYG